MSEGFSVLDPLTKFKVKALVTMVGGVLSSTLIVATPLLELLYISVTVKVTILAPISSHEKVLLLRI